MVKMVKLNTSVNFKMINKQNGTNNSTVDRSNKTNGVNNKRSKITLVTDEAGSSSSVLNQIKDQFEQICVGYDQFIIPNANNSAKYKELASVWYEYVQDNLKIIDSEVASTVRSQSVKPLRKLHVNGFDHEQIWQQLEVFNKPFLDNLVSHTSSLSSQSRTALTLNLDIKPKKNEENKSDAKSKSILKCANEEKVKELKKEKNKKVTFVSDDTQVHDGDTAKVNQQQKEKVDFFDFDEMEAFLDAEDRKEMDSEIKKTNDNEEDDEVDYFAEMDSDEEDDDDQNDYYYSDFFDPPKTEKIDTKLTTKIEFADRESDEELHSSDEDELDDEELDTRDFDEDELTAIDNSTMLEEASSDEENEQSTLKDPQAERFEQINAKLKALAAGTTENEMNDRNKSEFERSQLKLRQKIEKAERELLQPSNLHWQLSGEATGEVRPENSLLEEHLQFDHVSRPKPMITNETTVKLEDLIRQRIKDKAFDDVERKEKPNEQPFEFRRRILLESEKSKVGLAEVYEQEYLKNQKQLQEQQSKGSSSFYAAGEVEENETRKEIRRLMNNLFRKLDSLSAFHYTPRPPEPEVKIISNLPAITVEEVTPDTVSDMKLLAPEEVYSTRNKKVLQAKTERSSTDKKRSRRLKKKKQSIKQKLTEKKQKSNLNSTNLVKETDSKQMSKKQKSQADAVTGGFEKKTLTSSSKFFERLQETKEAAKMNKTKRDKPKPTENLAKKLKL